MVVAIFHQTRPKKGTKHSATCVAHTYWLPHLSWCQAAWMPCQEWKFFFIKHYWGILPFQQNVNSYQTHCG